MAKTVHDITDSIFKEIGEFGPYQFLVFALVGLVATIPGIVGFSFAFYAATPSFRCKIPGYANDTYDIQNENHQSLIDKFIPLLTDKSFNGIYERCTVKSFMNNSSSNNFTINDCSEWVFSKEYFESTLVTELFKMPKNKKKNRHTNPRSIQSGDDSSEFNADENASTISNASTNMSYQDLEGEEVKKGEEEYIEKIDNVQGQIDSCLDSLMEKGYKEREESLQILKKLFTHKLIFDSIVNKRFTISESLIKSLKKGKSNEQILAANVLMLTLVQLGPSPIDTNAIFADSRQILTELIDDEKVDAEVRAECVKCLALAVFLINENSTDTISILEKFANIFSNSFAKGDGTLRTHSPKVYELHAAALSSWCFLLCTMPLHFVNKLSQKYVPHFQDLLRSPDSDLRIVAGETISFLHELAQLDSHSSLACFEDENLLESLRALVTESSKFKSKKEKKQQRSSFRDILKTLEEGEFDTQTIKFGTESLLLDNWVKRKEYETLRDLLATGMNNHLAENEYLRDLFDLGPPVQGNEQNRKAALSLLTSKQKAQINKEQFKSRTKSLLKKRETKDYAQVQHMVDED